MPAELSPRFLARRVLQIAVVALVVVLAVATLPGLGEVRERFGGARVAWLLLALVLEAGSVVAFVAAFRGVFCPHLPWKLSFEIATAEQAANVLLPAGGAGGLALGAWALQRGGMATRHIARRSVALFLITSSVNFAAIILAGSALALGMLGSAPAALAVVPAGLAAVAVAAVIALPRLLPAAGRRPRGRVRGTTAAAAAALAEGIRDAGTLLRAHHWLVIGGALGYMAFDVATLAAGFLAFGSLPPPAVLLLAYGVGQLGGVIPVPGGIGGTDGALIAAFVLYGTSAPEATAAVLAYRAFQLGLPAIVGTVGFVRLQRTLAASRDPAALCAPMAASAAH
jgi:uncharacterized membrane protein YbhN (UPF0104 family)